MLTATGMRTWHASCTSSWATPSTRVRGPTAGPGTSPPTMASGSSPSRPTLGSTYRCRPWWTRRRLSGPRLPSGRGSAGPSATPGVLYLLQYLLRCAECGRTFRAQSRWRDPRHAGREAGQLRLGGAPALLLPARAASCGSAAGRSPPFGRSDWRGAYGTRSGGCSKSPVSSSPASRPWDRVTAKPWPRSSPGRSETCGRCNRRRNGS